MKKTKVIAMYLPQYHETKENSLFWGEGFTDWVTVKKAKSLYENHYQPRIPLNDNYYDLSQKKVIEEQAKLAEDYNIYGFAIYHYWFSSNKQTLTKPAEIILENKDIKINYLFAWDNISWKRTWSNVVGNDWAPTQDNIAKKGPQVLLEYIEGDQEEWEKHFLYLLPFFKDTRYIKKDGKPVFIIFNHSKKMVEMAKFWNSISQKYGINGIEIIFKYNPLHLYSKELSTFRYEPIFSGWGTRKFLLIDRIKRKLHITQKKESKLNAYSYDKIWLSIIKRAKKDNKKTSYFGAFVQYDDTPRRGNRGKVVKDSSPTKFKVYLKELMKISSEKNKEFLFLTAWNEWSEGAYLEPDTKNKFKFLEAISSIYEELK